MTITNADGTTWEPWTNGYAVGFKVTRSTGESQFIYLNPSEHDDGGVPNAFLYIGATGDPAADPACHYYDIPNERSNP